MDGAELTTPEHQSQDPEDAEYPDRPWTQDTHWVPLRRTPPQLYGPAFSAPGILVESAEQVVEWARSRSLWQMMFGLACCAIEMMATNVAHYDLDRFGTMPRASPRQSDLMIVAGTVTYKIAPAVERLYNQMAEPRWVIAMGDCATSGGIYYHGAYSVVKGVDQIVPVDVYISGCPPRPESLIEGILEVGELVRRGGRREEDGE